METSSKPPLKVAIGIATAGRCEQMRLTMERLALLRTAPSSIIICPASPKDFDAESTPELRCPVKVVHGPRGLTAQRNTIIAECEGIDVLLFIDDDYYPAEDYIEQVTALFERHPDIVIATNQPERDGATGPGIEHDDAVAVLSNLQALEPGWASIGPTYGGYGCNMAIRISVARERGVRFDEKLPLYGWLEDIDFSRRMSGYGRVVKYAALRGVHLGTKRGRTSGLRFGYSQIANPVYLMRKGSMSTSYAMRHMVRNVVKNVARSVWPEAWVDRHGRLKGNLMALKDLLRGALDPQRVNQLD